MEYREKEIEGQITEVTRPAEIVRLIQRRSASMTCARVAQFNLRKAFPQFSSRLPAVGPDSTSTQISQRVASWRKLLPGWKSEFTAYAIEPAVLQSHSIQIRESWEPGNRVQKSGDDLMGLTEGTDEPFGTLW